MRLRKRPAWRKQWLALLFAAILAIPPLMPYAADIGRLLQPYLPQVAKMIAGETAQPVPVEHVSPQLALMLAIPLLIMLSVIWYRRYSWLYLVDKNNIESRHGIIAREVHSIKLVDLRNINVKQTILERLLMIGDIEFSSAGSSGVEVLFHGVGRPLRIKKQIQEGFSAVAYVDD